MTTLLWGNVFLDYKRTVVSSKWNIEMYLSFLVADTSKAVGYVQLVFLWGMLAEMATTGGRVSQWVANQTHGFSHQQQDRSRSPVQMVAAEWDRVSL